MRAFYILSFLICIGWVSCKNDATTQKEGAASETPNYTKDTINPPKMETSSEAPTSQAGDKKSGGTYQVDAKQGHDYTFLTFKLFKINGAFVPGTDPKDQPYKDQWLDLLPDGTFKWYQGQQLSYSGLWGYNHDMGVLGLVPSDKNHKRTEWNVVFNDDMVVFTGAQAFENAGTQLQLIRKDQIE